MNLSEKIQKEKKAHFIKEFRNRYPEVYSWFNSYTFYDLFSNRQEVDLQIHRNKYGNIETVPVLPFTDSCGEVSRSVIEDYLEVEGFEVGMKNGINNCWFLTVKIKGE